MKFGDVLGIEPSNMGTKRVYDGKDICIYMCMYVCMYVCM